MVRRNFFSLMEPGIFDPILRSLLDEGDHYMLLADLRDYIETQDRVDAAYKDRDGWIRKAIMNVARAGKFSSDRTIAEYTSEIWHVEPVKIPNGAEAGPQASRLSEHGSTPGREHANGTGRWRQALCPSQTPSCAVGSVVQNVHADASIPS